MEKKASFGAYTEYWLQTVVQGTVKPNTYTVYRGLAKNHLLPSFGETPLKALDRKKMQLFSRRLRDEILVTPRVELVQSSSLPCNEGGKAVRVQDLRATK